MFTKENMNVNFRTFVKYIFMFIGITTIVMLTSKYFNLDWLGLLYVCFVGMAIVIGAPAILIFIFSKNITRRCISIVLFFIATSALLLFSSLITENFRIFDVSIKVGTTIVIFYLINRFTSGKVQKLLYIVLAPALLSLIAGSVLGKNTGGYIIDISSAIYATIIMCYPVYKFTNGKLQKLLYILVAPSCLYGIYHVLFRGKVSENIFENYIGIHVTVIICAILYYAYTSFFCVEKNDSDDNQESKETKEFINEFLVDNKVADETECSIYDKKEDLQTMDKPINKINIDSMTGTEFEIFCIKLLSKSGFSNIIHTGGANDQGADITAYKDSIKFAFQCKCYSSPLGNTPVQEALGGKKFRKCHVGVVITNSTFTKGAKELAKSTQIILWDRRKLMEMINKTDLKDEYFL